MLSFTYQLHELRGVRANQLCTFYEGGLRLRQHGTLFSFLQKIRAKCKFFVKKIVSSALPEATCPSGFETA